MALPRVERAMQAIVTRLQTILTAGGFHTNAGQRVFRARRSFAKPELPAISVWESGEAPKNGSGGILETTVSVAIEIHVLCGQADTGTQLGLAKSDVKQAIGSWARVEDAGGELGALTYVGAEPGPREDGGASESVRVSYTVLITESRADPSKVTTRG